MSRLTYLEKMVQFNKGDKNDPCAETYISEYKSPCYDDLINGDGPFTMCDVCVMSEYPRWFDTIKDLEECPELKPS